MRIEGVLPEFVKDRVILFALVLLALRTRTALLFTRCVVLFMMGAAFAAAYIVFLN